MTQAPPSQSTQNRILQMSAKLFNLHGIEAVSIGQISEALKISPGNFTYHYKKKSDLIEHHFRVIDDGMTRILHDFPINGSPRDFSNALVELMELVFSYRFLFLGGSYVIKNDLISAARYKLLINTNKRRFVQQIERLIAHDHMLPVKAPYSVEQLVDSIWWQWLGWLLSMQITPPKNVSDRKLVTEELINILFLNHHYTRPVFFRAVRAEIRKAARRPVKRAGAAKA